MKIHLLFVASIFSPLWGVSSLVAASNESPKAMVLEADRDKSNFAVAKTATGTAAGAVKSNLAVANDSSGTTAGAVGLRSVGNN